MGELILSLHHRGGRVSGTEEISHTGGRGKGKGRPSAGSWTREVAVGGHPICASRAAPLKVQRLLIRPFETSRTACHLPQMRPPSSWSGSIQYLPPALGGPAHQDDSESDTGSIPLSVSSRLLFLSIVQRLCCEEKNLRCSGAFLHPSHYRSVERRRSGE